MTDENDSPADRYRLLYVNDDAEFADLVRAKLSSSHPEFAITTVSNTEETLERLASSAVDCVVTGYALPDTTGIGLVETIRAEGYDLPAVLFTGRDSEQVVREASETVEYIPIHATEDSFALLGKRIRTLVDAARDQKRAKQVSDRFKRTLERATDAIYAVDDEWRIEYINEKMARRVDRDPEALVGATLWEAFPWIVGTELEDRYRTAMETGESATFEQYLAEPFDYWVEIRVFPDEDGLSVFSRETTAERERELELQRSETILQNVHDIVFVVDSDGVVQFSNSAAQRRLTGGNVGELEGQLLADVVGDRVSETDADRFSTAVRSSLRQLDSDGGTTGLYDSDLQL